MGTAGVCTLLGDTLAQVLPFLMKPQTLQQQHSQSKGSSTQEGSAHNNDSSSKPGSAAVSGSSLEQRSNRISSKQQQAFDVSVSSGGEHTDGSSQMTGFAGFKYDAARAARFLAFTVLLATPVAHTWFAFLDKVRA